jgi:hypothetical protein
LFISVFGSLDDVDSFLQSNVSRRTARPEFRFIFALDFQIYCRGQLYFNVQHVKHGIRSHRFSTASPPVRAHPGTATVAQTSKSAVSRVSKPANYVIRNAQRLADLEAGDTASRSERDCVIRAIRG